MAHYIVTGSSGFIASHTCESLLLSGHTITGIDNMNDAYDVRMKEYRLKKLKQYPNFIYSNVDITDLNNLIKVINSKYDGIINLGARAGVRASADNPFIYYETNVIGTLNLLEISKKHEIPKFVLASTSSVYGSVNSIPYSENDLTDFPLSQYAASKKAAENLTHTYHNLYDLDVTILRYFTVYGPAGRPDMSVMRFIKWIIEKEEIHLFGDGTQSRDFTYVGDIAKGTIAGTKKVGYETINLGSDHPVSLLKIISIIEKITGNKAIIKYLPENPLDIKATWADINKAKTILDWEPSTNIEKGINECIDWYLDNRGWAKNIVLF